MSQDPSESGATILVLGWISKHIGEDGGIVFSLFHAWREIQGQQRHYRLHRISCRFGNRCRKRVMHVCVPAGVGGNWSH